MDSTKDFSAIYNAKLVPWKRHWLAAKVKNLGLMYSKFGELESYYPKVKEFLPEAHFLNGDPTTADYQMFNHKQVAENLNRARVGLCLSKIEGAMYASIEYLLCGLPIVSTRSEGGRDLFFDEEYCAIVDDDPLAISNAVQRLESMSIDPRYIRKRTMDKILKFRASFVDLVNEIKRRHGLKEDGNHVLQSITSGDWACWRYSTLQYLHAFFSNDERLTI